MYREFTTPVGVDLVGIAGPTWQIAGIVVDNPTGSWLRIEDLNQYVPPYTIGWAATLQPTRLNVNVRFTNSPSGAISDLRGPIVKVTLYDKAISTSLGVAVPGQDSGAQSDLPKSANLYKRAYSGAISDDTADLIAANAVPNIIIPTRVEVRGTIDAAEPLRGIVRASWFYDPPVGSDVGIVSHSISPEHPSDTYDILPGTFEIPANSRVYVIVNTQPDQGTSEVDAALFYYTLAAGS